MKKVAIVGFSDISRDLAPYDDPEWEIWGCNHVFQYAKRVDAIFEIHRPGHLEAYYHKNWPAYREALANFKGRLFMIEKSPEIPNAEPLPIERLKEEFSFTVESIEHTNAPPDQRKVLGREQTETAIFKSTISYMVAIAVLEGAPEIAIYGCDMSVDSEWFFQRHNLYFFLGWARARGVKVVIPAVSHLMKEQGWVRLYGYDQEQSSKYKDLIHDLLLEVEQFDQHQTEENKKQDRMAYEMDQAEGIAREYEALLASGSLNGDAPVVKERMRVVREKYAKLREEVTVHLQAMHYTQGMRDYAHRVATRLGYHTRGEMVEQ